MEQLKNKILLGDCLEVMRSMPDKSIDLLLTDPPYGIGADRGANGFGSGTSRKYAGGWDKSAPAPEYFTEMLRVSKYAIIFGCNYFTDRLPVSKTWLVWDKVGSFLFENPFADVELAWTNLPGGEQKVHMCAAGICDV